MRRKNMIIIFLQKLDCSFVSGKDCFRVRHFDAICNEMNSASSRFNQKGVIVLGKIETLLVKGLSGEMDAWDEKRLDEDARFHADLAETPMIKGEALQLQELFMIDTV